MSNYAAIEQFLQQALAQKQQSGLLRSMPVNDNLVDFCSNDYLGFVFNNHLTGTLKTRHDSGSTGSRLISGNSALAEETEQQIAAFHNAEAALIFNTGYMANVGLFSCIADKHATFIYDEHCHASMIDGMRLSYATRHKFKHNNVADLQKKLKQATGNTYVAVESVYSMDGDLAPLNEIALLCQQYGAGLIVDEAHATGIFGNNGEGLVSALHLEDLVLARIHTFGKALGHHGAAITGSYTLRQYLVNHARSFIYTTALPPHTYACIQEAYHLLPQADRSALFNLATYFKKQAETLHITCLVNDSPIQAIVVPGNHEATAMAVHLKQHGFFVKAILSPTVPEGTERIRLCLHSFNTTDEIDHLFTAIKSYTP